MDIIDFIANSPSSFHAAHCVADALEKAGFRREYESQPWSAEPGGHYIIRGGAIMAWFVPQQSPRGFKVLGAHTDSPGLWLKPDPEFYAHGFHQIGVEIYGGPILESFFDRELSVAGRVILKDGSSRLVNTGPIARVPWIAPHLERKPSINPQTSMQPVTVRPILDSVAQAAGIERGEIAAHDLITVDSQRGARIDDAIMAPRLDNLSSVWAATRGLINAASSYEGEHVLVAAFFDHEEVGSASATGAAGPILEDLIMRTADALTKDPRQMIAASSCVSADAAHSIHPNFAHLHDQGHQPLLGHGPVTKVNAKQRYASEGRTIAMWERACQDAGVEVQRFSSNNAVACGSTIGPITATRLGIPTVDVGVPLLSMHSAREMASHKDLEALALAIEQYFSQAFLPDVL